MLWLMQGRTATCLPMLMFFGSRHCRQGAIGYPCYDLVHNRVSIEAVGSLARARRGTTAIDEEALHGDTAMILTSYEYIPLKHDRAEIKFGFGTPSTESGKAVLASKTCIHRKPFGNADVYCFYKLEVVQW